MKATPLDAFLSRHVNEVLARGALGAAVLGYLSAALLWIFILTGVGQALALPACSAFFAGAYSTLAWALARRGRVRGWVLYALLLPFVSIPTAFFAVTHLTLPAGAASYITGPFSYLYFILIALTAFTFDRRLSWAAGVLSAAGYLGAYALSRPQLSALSHPDPVLLQDLREPQIYLFKAMMMVFAGTLAGAATSFARRVVTRVAKEERDRAMVERLFGEYVSEEVRERLLAQPSGTLGERKQVVVLFSDIRGFSTFSERHPPEAIVQRLNAYFDRMVAALSGQGGVVDKFIGDAVMGVFGGVVPLENPRAAAFEAAVAMRAALAELNAQWQRPGWEPFENGVGLDYGDAVVGPLGSERRKDFTVIGDTVNTASRAEGLCKELGSPIVLTESVYEGLTPGQQAACVPLGEVKVKGKSRMVRVFGVRDEVSSAAMKRTAQA